MASSVRLASPLARRWMESPCFADIVDGKFYISLNAAVFQAYKKDKAGILAKAVKNWPGIHHSSVEEVNRLGS